jgi:hypothetical protein
MINLRKKRKNMFYKIGTKNSLFQGKFGNFIEIAPLV